MIGGVAVSVWFRPRATYDVDFTVLLRREEASRFIGCLGQEYVPLQSDPTQALRRSGVLFVREESGIRLDLQLADVGFDESAIQRTVEIRAGARPNYAPPVSTHPSEPSRGRANP